VGIDLKRLIRLITDRAHEIFCIDCVGAYSRAIPCAGAAPYSIRSRNAGPKANRILYGALRIRIGVTKGASPDSNSELLIEGLGIIRFTGHSSLRKRPISFLQVIFLTN
jgi:hypothetical protein